MLKIGQKAPEFSLPNQDDNVISLKDFKGQKLLIWFFPKASTSGCTKEGIGFNELIKNFNKQNISCLLYTSPSPRDLSTSRMPSSA